MAKTEHDSFTQSAYAEAGYSPLYQPLYLQHHRPSEMQENNYHFHPSIEVNFLQKCDMQYSFSGKQVKASRDRLVVFWAAYPHRVTKVIGKGKITNVYISLSEFLQWPLPNSLVSELLSGAVITSTSKKAGDAEMAGSWAKEVQNVDQNWQRLHILEIQSRLYRLAIDGWDRLLENQGDVPEKIIGGQSVVQFEKMLRFIGNFYADPIKVYDVAQAGGITPNAAITLFRKMLGRTIKQHITELRLNHARMLLAETDHKILSVSMSCGYTTLSSFYKAFQEHQGISPAAFRNGSTASRPK